MERDVRYIVVGIVVALLIAAFAGFAAWQAGGYSGEETKRYTILFEGGVAGLAKGGRVRYRGVQVGRVEGVGLMKNRPRVVRVDIRVDPATPITRETRAQIKPQGITGLSYIELLTKEPGPPPEVPEGRRYPVIQAEASPLDQVLEDMPQMVERLNGIAARIDRILSEENVRRIDRTLANAADLSERLGDLTRQAEGTLAEVDRTVGEAGDTLDEVDRTMARARGVMPEARKALEKVGALAGRLDALVARHEDRIDRLAGDDLDELRRVLRESRRTLAEIQGLARSLQENPSRIVFPPRGGGMEVPR